MIRYLPHGKIDKALWDDCVAHAFNGLAYACSWYLDVAHEGWEALVEEDGGQYLAVMPLTGNRKYGIPYLFQPFFVQQLGVFARQPLTSEKVLEFLRAIPKKFWLVEIRLNEKNPLPESLKGVEYHRDCLLDLLYDYQTLSSHYHENTNRNLKKSLKCCLQLVKEVPMRVVIDLFRKDRGAEIRHWKDREYARLERLVDVAIASQNALVYGVRKSDSEDVVCGALFLKFKERIIFLFSGNSEVGKSCQAMTFLLDQVIQEFSNQPFLLDFEGSDDPNLARYYLGFGSEERMYPSYTRTNILFRIPHSAFRIFSCLVS